MVVRDSRGRTVTANGIVVNWRGFGHDEIHARDVPRLHEGISQMKPRDRRGEDLSYYWDRGSKNVMVEVEEGDVIHVRRCQGLEELRCSRQGGKGASLLHSQTIMEASSDVVDLAGPIGGPCWHETCWADLSGVRETLSCLHKENQNLQCNKTTTRGQGVDGIRYTRKPCRQSTTCGPPFACN